MRQQNFSTTHVNECTATTTTTTPCVEQQRKKTIKNANQIQPIAWHSWVKNLNRSISCVLDILSDTIFSTHKIAHHLFIRSSILCLLGHNVEVSFSRKLREIFDVCAKEKKQMANGIVERTTKRYQMKRKWKVMKRSHPRSDTVMSSFFSLGSHCKSVSINEHENEQKSNTKKQKGKKKKTKKKNETKMRNVTIRTAGKKAPFTLPFLLLLLCIFGLNKKCRLSLFTDD